MPAAIGVSLGLDDVRVCFRAGHVQAADGSAVVSVQPTALAQNPVMVVSRLGIDPDSAEGSYLARRCDAQLSFTIRGFPRCDARAAVLAAMAQAKAFPTPGCRVLVPA
eukprot:1456108-Alexandrium_andersonii.AAC.1